MLEYLNSLTKKQKIIIYSAAAAIAAIAAIIATIILVHTVKNPPTILFNSNSANYITSSNFSNFETTSGVYIPEATITIVTDGNEQKLDEIVEATNQIKQTPQNSVVIKPYSVDKSLLSKRQVKLDVNYLPQNPELPTGCEITALTTVLNYYGYNVTKTDMSDNYLEKSLDKLDDFWEVFVGNPRGNGFGCYAKPIVKAANKYLADQDNKYTAVNYSGAQFEDLLKIVEDGTPVVIWATMYSQKNKTLCEAYVSAKWNVNGKEVKWLANEHCMVLIGYDLDKNVAIVSDPQRGIVEYDLETLKARYTAIHSQSVVIRESIPTISGVTNGSIYYTTQCVTVSSQNLESVLVNGVEQKSSFLIDGNADNIYIIEATNYQGYTTTCTIYTKEISSLVEPINNIRQLNVTEDDLDAINSVRNKLLKLNTDYASKKETAVINDFVAHCDNLLQQVSDITNEYNRVTNLAKKYLQDENKPNAVTTLIEDIRALLSTENLTNNQRTTLQSTITKLQNISPETPQIESEQIIIE